ncbi:MAG: hypothetical protein OXI02_03335 [Candidatus Dadabacteria bacterium]|nr:hypothetical protein [Candidatus Dadabacteria bacterium]MDE0158788.1 hypothetical protein [Candidatus Dadabacteria bacterium]MDE0291347.1 hypothetical protein [Candidatus Dadabacteria bacterium]MDE0477081.1 hypothetical protein [Candidatus Dadabacteria bacterium]MDE0662501.1 hypothetical protein [Candidatus Dadabacteria bacterium]
MTHFSEDEAMAALSSYVKGVTDQEIKVLILKLKNEIRKEDVTWEQIREILAEIKSKDGSALKDIIPFLVY